MVELEKEHVHKVYSKIAVHFSDTRFKPWPRIAQFLQERPLGSLIADVGCGNGKYLGVNPQVYAIGSDICSELVAIGRGRSHEVMSCDCLNLPYRTNLFDGAISIAVIHHLSTEDRRVDALRELCRVLRPGGELLVYVWAMEQERKKFDSQDVMVPWHLQPKYNLQKTPTVDTAARNRREEKAAKARAKKEEKKRKKKSLRDEATNSEMSCGGDGDPGERLMGDLADINLEDEDFIPSKARPIKMPHSPPKDVTTQSSTIVDSNKSLPLASEPRELGYTTYQRYYHVFKAGELLQLFGKVTDLQVKEEFYDHENWCIIATKNCM